MARKRNKKGNLIPFAAGLVVGYLLTRKSAGTGGGGGTTTVIEIPGTSTASNALPRSSGNIIQMRRMGALNIHAGARLQPDYHNMYL